MKCSNCGNEIESGRLSCPNCGSMVLQSSYTQTPVNGKRSGNGGIQASSKNDKLSLIFGILSPISLLVTFVSFSWADMYAGIYLGICLGAALAAIIFSVLAIVLKRQKKAGMLLGIITISIVVIILAVSLGQSIGYDEGYENGYENGYDVPLYDKIFE